MFHLSVKLNIFPFQDVNAIPLSESTFVSKLDTWRTNLLHAFGVGYLIRVSTRVLFPTLQ